MSRSDPISNLISAFSKLPGIGERTASRLAFYIVDESDDVANELAGALKEVENEINLCERCRNLTDQRLCSICRHHKRDHSTICVVESTPDLRAIERTGEFNGVYHVLHGLISPLDGVGPDDIHIKSLIERLQSPEKNGDEKVDEIIVATSPSVDGEATSLYLSKMVGDIESVEATRIASGVPIGEELEYTDKSTLSRALSERRDIQ